MHILYMKRPIQRFKLIFEYKSGPRRSCNGWRCKSPILSYRVNTGPECTLTSRNLPGERQPTKLPEVQCGFWKVVCPFCCISPVPLPLALGCPFHDDGDSVYLSPLPKNPRLQKHWYGKLNDGVGKFSGHMQPAGKKKEQIDKGRRL